MSIHEVEEIPAHRGRQRNAFGFPLRPWMIASIILLIAVAIALISVSQGAGKPYPSVTSSGTKTEASSYDLALENLDFEQDMKAWLVRSNVYYRQPENYIGGTSNLAARTGKLGAYLRMLSDIPTPTPGPSAPYPDWGPYGILQYDVPNLDDLRGKRVRLSVYMNADQVEQHATLYLRAGYKANPRPVADEHGEVMIAESNIVHNTCTSTSASGWQKREVELDVPTTILSLSFGARLNGGGEVWIDDFDLQVIGEAESAISSPNGSPTPQVGGATSMPIFATGFEGTLEKWTKNVTTNKDADGDYRAILDYDTMHSGNNSALIESTAPSSNGVTLLWTFADATPYKGKRVHLTAYLKTEAAGLLANGSTEAVPNKANLWLATGTDKLMTERMSGFDTQPLSQDIAELEGTTSWKRYEVEVDIPPTASYIYVGLNAIGDGKVWIDDLVLEPSR